MATKRLFLFAGYDQDGIIDNTLVHYLASLSKLGDIILVMDCDVPESEMQKLSGISNMLHASGVRHGEYDFGSYKRAYQYAHKNDLLSKYDWIYLCNDSVYGPLYDILPNLTDLESRGVDLTGMIDFENKWTPPQVQSWFVGISRRVATADFIYNFMNSVCPQSDKQLIVLKYEVGLTRQILQHGYKMSTFISGENGDIVHSMYHKPLNMLKCGIPFVKKAGLENLFGLQYLYPYTTDALVDNIYHNAVRCGIPFTSQSSSRNANYTKVYRLTILSMPLLTVRRQLHEGSHQVCHKVYLFDFIPVAKIYRRK